ncbi:hypothetical protein TrST_g3684 [Triparma strigata]|uniref:Uncharacterized protein n=1 Tax=Triparma strigata TaxID=1606541 RepID=A0A9W6ZMN3_9STRA|nr:hypothetical protein TrST_g3684 [Triparma strigata]
MASRHKLASAPHYKTNKKTHRFKRGPTGNDPNPKVTLHDDESGLEKKLKIKLEAKVIMDRINKITDDFGTMVSTAVPPPLESTAPSASASASASSSSKPSSPSSPSKPPLRRRTSAKGGEVQPTEIVKNVLTSEMQFKQFQQSKGQMTMLMVDHEKLGLEQTTVLQTIKDWFFFVRSGAADVDEDDDDLTDFTSLLEVMKETRNAVRNVENVTENTSDKLSSLFGDIKKVYNQSVDLRKDVGKTEADAAKHFEEELKKSEDLVEKLQLDWKEERATLKSKLQHTEEKISKNIKNVTGEKTHLEILVSELTKKTIELEAMNIKLETKNRIAEQIIREPMFGSSLSGGGGGDNEEKKKLEAQIKLLELKIRELMTQLTKKSERLAFLEEKHADAEQDTMMRIQAATKKAQKETRAEFEEQTRKFQEMTALVEELAGGREDADAEFRLRMESLATEHKQTMEALEAKQKEELTHYRSELTAKQIELDEMQENVDKVEEKMEKKKEDEKKGRQARASDIKQSEAKLAEANLKNEEMEAELEELKRQLKEQKEETKSLKKRALSSDSSDDPNSPKARSRNRVNSSSLAEVEGEVKEELERLRSELKEAHRKVSAIEAVGRNGNGNGNGNESVVPPGSILPEAEAMEIKKEAN